MTIDEHIASQALASTTNLDPINIPGRVEPVQTEGADVGVGYNLAYANESGLTIVIPVYLNMATNDWIEVFWGDDDHPVASDLVPETAVGEDFSMYVASSRIPEGVHPLYCKVTRSGGGNGGESLPINVLVRFDFPGGIDPEPHEPGHQNLPPPEPELPDNGIIDEEAAKNGVKVSIFAYPNIREYDRITLSWGGVLLKAEVTQADIDAGFLDILVTEETILAAGDSDRLILVYRVVDEVHNQSSDWSPPTDVIVEVGEGRLSPPLIDNPDEDAVDWDVIDLDKLGDSDLKVEVIVISGGPLQVGDEVALRWVGTTSLGQDIVVEPEPESVTRPTMILSFEIPNADLRQLARGRGVASYTATRDGVVVGVSKRAFVTFLGVEQGLPKPTVRESVAGALDPQLEQVTVVVPGDALQADDVVLLTWLGTHADGTPLLYTTQRPVSSGGDGQPMLFSIPGERWLAPLDGGEVSVYYRIGRAGSPLPLESERERLTVGEARAELPAPDTRPPAQGGMLDPDTLPLQLEIVVAVYPGMVEGQTVQLLWRASQGPNHSDSVLLNPFSVGHEVVFTLTTERVRENLGAQVEISYQVLEPGQPTRLSDILVVGIGTAQLPLAVFTAADTDNRLDINDVLDGAEVLIDASAAFKDGDRVTVQVISGVSGGTHSIEHRVDPGEAGQQVRVTVPYEVIAVSVGTEITLSYEIQRSAGGPVEPSDINPYQVIRQAGSGDLLVMGARWNASTMAASRSPRMLSAFEASTGKPLQAEWRYDGSSEWAQASQWVDTHPWLKLYVRSRDEAVLLNPANIFGNGQEYGTFEHGAFVAMRDERQVDGQPVVDIVAWGTEEYGGKLQQEQLDLTDVVEVSCTRTAFAVRLRSARVLCWGSGAEVNLPVEESDDFCQVRSNAYAFLGRKCDGRLFAWGVPGGGVPVPPNVEAHRDYVELCGGMRAFAARRESGHVLAWGDRYSGGELNPGQDDFTDVTAIIGNPNAFAALRRIDSLGRLMAWGGEDSGGALRPPISDLTNVRSLGAATRQAFTVILGSNSVRGWGEQHYGGDIPEEIRNLNNVVEVTSTTNAFCARLADGRVVAWPYRFDEGCVPEDIAGLTNIVQVVGNARCFAALCLDGSVVAWGDPALGGDTSQVAEQLHDVRAIYGNPCAFTALTADGRVVTWGRGESGGDSSEQQAELAHKVTVGRRISLAEAEVVAGVDKQQTSG